MKKILSLFALVLLSCTGAWADGITALSQLSNNKVYAIRTASTETARGSLYYDSRYSGYLSSTGTVWQNGSDIYDANDDNCKFAIYKSALTGNYYFYSIGAGKFVKSDGVHARLTDAIEQNITFTNATSAAKETNPWVIVFNNGGGNYLGITDWAYYNDKSDKTPVGAITYDKNAGDKGTNMAIVEVEDISSTALAAIESGVTSYEASFISDLQAKISTVYAACTTPGVKRVGYPNVTTNAATIGALYQYTDNFSNSITVSNYDAALAALNAVYAITDVYLPEAGKAYYIKGRYANGATKYLVHNGSHSLTLSDTPEAFIVGSAAGSKYVLVGEDNYYFAVTADSKNANVHETYDADKCAITLAHVAPNFTGSSTYTEGNPEVYFGTLAIQGKCGSETFYIMSKPAGTLHNSASTYVAYNTQSGNYLSSLFEFEEVENPNKLTLSNPNPEGTSGLDNKSVGTFSAPFAVQLPDGVEAYKASVSGSTVTFETIGSVVPANTGVVVYASDDATYSNVNAVPAAAVASSVSGNALVATTGEEIPEGSYILANSTKGVSFYLIGDNRVVAKNKAYLEVPAGSNLNAFRFDFEGDVTGIEALESNTEATVFDLQGRRVQGAKSGLYIVNGKKVIR